MMKNIELYPQQQISIPNIASVLSFKLIVRSIVTLGVCSGFAIPASAQITYEGGKAAAQSTPGTFNIPISEGKQTGGNVFHSFGTFGLQTNQVANFEANNSVQNILGRVTGGLPSSIDGTLRVTGGNANLYLMNPAGIVFGKNASLDINGAFTATTAKAIDFGNGNWFNALGANTYTELNGNPIGLAFPGSTPGSIFSAANLTTKPGQSITLVGGTVISTGDIKTAGGNISIATVEGGKYVEIKAEGNILRVDLPISANNINAETKSFTALSLPELLTATKPDLVATGVKNENGVVTLVGNPAADALALDLDKALANNQKARADYTKAIADYQKADEDYTKALAAVGNDETLVDKAIITARDNAQSVSTTNSIILTDTAVSLSDIQKKLVPVTAVGDRTTIASDINLGDTVSKQNRPIDSGDVITRNLNTSNINKGGDIDIQSSQAIFSGNINTQANDSSINPRTFLGGTVVLNAQTELKVKQINTSISSPPFTNIDNIKKVTGTYKGGNVILSTQTKDIVVDSIRTTAANDEGTLGSRLSKAESTGLLGGNVTIKAAGLFRVITIGGIESSLFGIIDIEHGSKKPFASGAIGAPTNGSSGSQLIEGFTFPDGASGSRGQITTSRGTNGSIGVIYKDQSIDGLIGIKSVFKETTPVTPVIKTDDTKPVIKKEDTKPVDKKEDTNTVAKKDDNNTVTKDEKQKSKQDCTPRSTSVAANSTTDPNRSEGNASTPSADPCQLVTGTAGGTLQILNDKN
jgi:filamentous hemagglutinin family protein